MPRRYNHEDLKEPKPQSFREVPDYLKRIITKFFSRLFYIFMLVWEARPLILFVMLFMALFNGVMPVLGALLRAQLLNALASAYKGAAAFQAVMGMIVLLFGFNLCTRLVNNVNSIITRISGEVIVNHIKIKIMNKAKTIDLACFDMPDFYEKLENANREAGQRPMQILHSTLSIISTGISMVSYIFILWAVSPYLPLIVVLISIPSAIVNFIYRSKNVTYIKQRSKDRRQMGYYSNLVVNKDMVKEIRIFGLSDLFIDRYKEIFGHYFSGHKKLIVGEGVWHMGLTVFTTVVNCFMFLFLAKLVCDGVLEIGTYSLYTGALGSISGGVGSLINTTATIYEGTLFIDNMIVFMNQDCTIVPLLSEPLHVERETSHTIEFVNVTFRYPGTERDVLKNINLKFEPGDTAVLVGVNGAGKTTLIKLLTRLYDPTEGKILLDGNDIRDYNIKELYQMFGIIFQDFGKYAVSVTENIRFGQLDKLPTDENIQLAAVKSGADAYIRALPDQYETPLMRYFEDNGIELSIGQWQKLSIARAFYSDSDIVILDEPTASLDPLAEQEIFNQFDALRGGKTTIFVSHRLSSATVANKIIVLENGQVIEEGNHQTLMEKRGRYHELFTTQAQRYLSTDQTGIKKKRHHKGEQCKHEENLTVQTG